MRRICSFISMSSVIVFVLLIFITDDATAYSSYPVYGRGSNFCELKVTKMVSCKVRNGTTRSMERYPSWCNYQQLRNNFNHIPNTGSSCFPAQYRIIFRPKYLTAYKPVETIERQCCPGFSGPKCDRGCFNCSEMAALKMKVDQLEYRPHNPYTSELQASQGGAVVLGPKGPPGAQGKAGSPGSDGKKGSDGEKGVVGEPGQPGRSGPVGEVGLPGPAGATGPQGPPGDPGRMGLQGPAGPPGTPAELPSNLATTEQLTNLMLSILRMDKELKACTQIIKERLGGIPGGPGSPDFLQTPSPGNEFPEYPGEIDESSYMKFVSSYDSLASGDGDSELQNANQ